jgi:hypothetical protein
VRLILPRRESHGVQETPKVLGEPQYERDDRHIEWPIEHRDVTTIMALLGDIAENVRAIRAMLEEEDGQEEEGPEVDS